MNARVGDLVKELPDMMLWRLAPALAAAAGLAGCVANPLAAAPVDPASPIAGEVAAIAAADRPFPTFADIPKLPEDPRPAGAVAAARAELRAEGEALARATAPETWTLDASEAFAARAQSAVRDEPPYARAGGDAEAFAREQRERATPPPRAR